MTKQLFGLLSLALLLGFGFSACHKDKHGDAGKFILKLDERWGSGSFELNTTYTANNGQVRANQLRYYITNVELGKAEGGQWVEAESYHLVDKGVAGTDRIELKNVEHGTYNRIRFMLGVDSTRNVSGAQTGALDPAKGMFWSWNTGYIFFRMEGEFPSVPDSIGQGFRFHLGGFREANNATRWVEFSLDNLEISKKKGVEAHFHLDLKKVLEGGPHSNIVLEDYRNVQMPGQKAMQMMDNVAAALALDHIH